LQITFEQIFKHSDILNPLSPTTLLSAGKVGQMTPGKSLLDLGSGKGYPSLLWASAFGVGVKGVDLNQTYVDYANSRAKLLNLSNKAEYLHQDLKDFATSSRYDIVAALGLDLNGIYGGRIKALQRFRAMLKSGGVLILAEPIWLRKPVPSDVLEALRIKEDDFVTVPQMKKLTRELGFEERKHFISSKEDWDLYVRPLYISLQEIIAEEPELTKEAQRFIHGFETEYDAAGKFWNMALWALKQAQET